MVGGQSDRDGREVVIRVVLDAFSVVDERGGDDDADDEKEDEQHQLVSTGLERVDDQTHRHTDRHTDRQTERHTEGDGHERVDEDLESRRMTRELEQPHDADDAKELENVVVLLRLGLVVLLLYVVVLLYEVEQEVEVEAERGDKVDDIDRCQDERALVRTHHEPNVTQRNALSVRTVQRVYSTPIYDTTSTTSFSRVCNISLTIHGEV